MKQRLRNAAKMNVSQTLKIGVLSPFIKAPRVYRDGGRKFFRG